MIRPSLFRPDGHVPVHRHRRLDGASSGRWGRPTGPPERAPPAPARRGRRRRRHPDRFGGRTRCFAAFDSPAGALGGAVSGPARLSPRQRGRAERRFTSGWASTPERASSETHVCREWTSTAPPDRAAGHGGQRAGNRMRRERLRAEPGLRLGCRRQRTASLPPNRSGCRRRPSTAPRRSRWCSLRRFRVGRPQRPEEARRAFDVGEQET